MCINICVKGNAAKKKRKKEYVASKKEQIKYKLFISFKILNVKRKFL